MTLTVVKKTPQAGSLTALNPVLVWQSPNPDSPSSASSNRVTFRVKNPGGGIVRVLSARSGCGCARPKVRFDRLGPGEVGAVDVDPTPIDVGIKSVPITLTTDSATTPEVSLTVRLIGTRRPPYLLEARGDLTFRDAKPGAEAEFDATTVTPVSVKESPRPIVRSTLPFLNIKLVNVRERPSADDPGVKYFYHTYQATIAPEAPEADFRGEIVAGDPWYADRFFRLHVLGTTEPPLRAIPTELRLETGEDSARLTIASRQASGNLRVEVENNATDALSVERVGRADRFETFLVRRRTVVATPERTYHLVITTSESPEAHLSVPVHLGRGGQQ